MKLDPVISPQKFQMPGIIMMPAAHSYYIQSNPSQLDSEKQKTGNVIPVSFSQNAISSLIAPYRGLAAGIHGGVKH